MNRYPLVVDLDGSLIHTDMLQESAIHFYLRQPLTFFKLPLQLLKGKAALKAHLASKSAFNPSLLPYHQELISWLKIQKSQGRQLILCTASDQLIAQQIADHLGLFDEVISSNGHINLKGQTKAHILEQRFGFEGFDYVGNSKTDIAVWARARQAHMVNNSKFLKKKIEKIAKLEQVFSAPTASLSVWFQALRGQQWLKNILLFIPLLAAHQLNDMNHWGLLILAFFSFSLCASSVYLTNDLLDLEADRQHPRKKNRPFASGTLPIWQGMFVAPCLLILSLFIGLQINLGYFYCLLCYFALACAYSWSLKRLILVDCITLASLYTLRIIAGAFVVSIDLSFWMLTFSIFLFLSLAFIKRCAELKIQTKNKIDKISGRGYYVTDGPLIEAFGIISGYISVLILALYINSDTILKLYKAPVLVWPIVPLMLFWVSWVWLNVHRGIMSDDPLLFAIKDRSAL